MTSLNQNNENEYKKFISSIRDITSNTLILNEADDNKSDDDNDADLNALLKDDAGLDDNSDKDSGDKNNDSKDFDFNNLDKDDQGSNEDNKDSGEDDLGDLELDKPKEDENKFETDSEGLMDTITRLTKAGHTVKIIVSAEGQQYIFNDRKVSGKQLKALAEMILPKVKKSKNFNNALMEEINGLKKEIKQLKSGKLSPVSENKVMKIYANDYSKLIENQEDMARLLEEKEALIKNFESMNSFNALDEAYDNDMIKMMNDFSESMDEINKLTYDTSVKTASVESYAKGADVAFNIMNEDIMPILTSSLDTKARILSNMDADRKLLNTSIYMMNKLNESNDYRNNEASLKVIPEDISKSLNKLNSLTESINKQNKFEKLQTLMENKLKYKKSFTCNEVMRLLTEASDIVAYDNDPDYDGTLPTKCDSFEERVAKTINSALAGRNKSDISVIPDDEGNLIKRNDTQKFDIPIKREGFSPNTTVKSAIMQLAESLTDIDGKLNIDLCKKAYLYQKVNNPTSMKDFAIPIALLDESDGKLYAHPKLIEFAANMLSSDKSMRTYGITSRRELEALRESLMPYLKELGIEAPWAVDPNDNFSDTNKKKEKKSK